MAEESALMERNGHVTEGEHTQLGFGS